MTCCNCLYCPVSRRFASRSWVRLAKASLGIIESILRNLQHNFDCLATLHQLEALVELLQRQLVRDDLVQLDLTRQKERFDLVPRLKHPSAVDAENCGTFEDNVVG